MLNHWDAGWYTKIIVGGYEKQSYAFYPLYPFTVKMLSVIPIPISVMGAIFSTVCWLTFCLITYRTHDSSSALRPKTTAGWLLFLFAPGSMVFLTHHTESLFMLLMLGALSAAHHKRLLRASVLAGLCALTRNHGVLVAICVGYILASNPPYKGPCNWPRFIKSGLISGSLFSLYLLFQWQTTGTPFAFIEAQQHWSHAVDLYGYFKTFFFANPWQNTNMGSIAHHLFYFLMIGMCFITWRIHRPIALLTFAFLALLPMHGELVNAFRYCTVLFPIFYIFGDWLAERRAAIIGWCLILGFLFLNHMVTRNYALGRWAY